MCRPDQSAPTAQVDLVDTLRRCVSPQLHFESFIEKMCRHVHSVPKGSYAPADSIQPVVILSSHSLSVKAENSILHLLKYIWYNPAWIEPRPSAPETDDLPLHNRGGMFIRIIVDNSVCILNCLR